MMASYAYFVAMLLGFGTLQVPAQGQQVTPPPGATTQTRGGGTRTTPQPATTAPLPQGFSVVLVLGDIQAAPGQDDVPPAARKALTDMKDFLPYKSYRLLDAAWVLCCGRDHRTNALAERNLIAESFAGSSGHVTTQLRGPESKEYELRLSASRAEGARAFVRFSLMESGDSTEAEEAMSAAETSRQKELSDLRARAESLEKQAKSNRDKGLVYKNIEQELEGVRSRITELTTRAVYETARRQRVANKAVIDTSFTMDLGETVVVGTSRLKAGSKALIALLTAVPPKGATRTPDEIR